MEYCSLFDYAEVKLAFGICWVFNCFVSEPAKIANSVRHFLKPQDIQDQDLITNFSLHYHLLVKPTVIVIQMKEVMSKDEKNDCFDV